VVFVFNKNNGVTHEGRSKDITKPISFKSWSQSAQQGQN